MQQLLNPFAQKYPEAVDSTLTSSSNVVRFNPTGPFAGHYIASGGSDGVVEIWSLITRGLVRILEGHVKPVTSVSWSRQNRYLATGSTDSTVIVWDLSMLSHSAYQPTLPIRAAGSSTARLATIRLDAPVSDVQFHPRNSKILLITLAVGEVLLVDLREGGGKTKLEDVGEVADPDEDPMDGEGAAARIEVKRATLACATWSPCGSRIYAGTTQGEVLFFDPPSRIVLHRYKVAGSPLRQIAFDPKGQNIVLGCTDRALRTLAVHPLTGLLNPIHRYQDMVNRTPWNAIGFSGDGEYVMGGAAHKMAHNVFIWDKSFGTLVKVLEGPRESLAHCDWHPTRPVIASVALSGDIHLWQIKTPDNWAAFAQDFEELEENIEYDEREDEFDIEDETELSRRKDLEEDVDIDVLAAEDTFPRKPQPYIPSKIARIALETTPTEGAEESEEIRSVRLIMEAKEWADAEPDDDTWEGFFVSLDLNESLDEEECGI